MRRVLPLAAAAAVLLLGCGGGAASRVPAALDAAAALRSAPIDLHTPSERGKWIALFEHACAGDPDAVDEVQGLIVDEPADGGWPTAARSIITAACPDRLQDVEP